MNSKKLAVVLLLIAMAGISAILLSKSTETTHTTTASKEGTGMSEKLKDLNTYTNSMTLMATAKEQYANDPRNGQSYPAGDPYILKYNGMYYLYPSTHFGLSDVRAWSSVDLVNWNYEGIVAKDDRLKMAYAPEVIYWNGAFYMVTSPDGKGHFVLKSDSPTGPFTIQTDNLGMSIDGSVFVDDDGKWYFYHAGSKGIRGREMKDPYTFGAETVLKGTSMNHWTEGSTLIKRNGTYFMMESGNHLMSAGYRVNYSISKNGPLGDFTMPYNNPLIISTTKDFHGLGHSTTVMGPDLDSYYIAYHNNKNPIAPGVGHDRHLNVDRLVFNGDKLDVLGPTNFTQQAPGKADFATWIQKEGLESNWSKVSNGGATMVVSKKQTGTRFTAEFNFKAEPAAQNERTYAGAVFGYRDDKHYGMAIVHSSTKQLELIQVINGERHTWGTAELPSSMDMSPLHMLRIEQDHGRTVVYFDGMQKLDMKIEGLGAGQIGYIYEGLTLYPDYTAFSNEVNGTSDYDAYKPLPGSIEAVHYLKGEGRGYRMTNNTLSENPIRPDDRILIGKVEDNSYFTRLSHQGDWLQYNVNVKETAAYGMDLRLKDQKDEAVIAVYSDDQFLGNIKFPALAPSERNTTGWTKVKGDGLLSLQSDLHTLKIQLVKGKADLMGFDLYKVEDKPLNLVYPLGKGGDLANGLFSDWTYNDRWSVGGQGMKSDSDQTNMAFTGMTGWGDYSVEADVTLGAGTQPNSEGGLLVRVNNESVHKAQVVDGLMGYYISLSANQLALKKLNYDSTLLQKTDLNLETNKTYPIQVRVKGSRIQVFFDKQSKPSIDYVDFNAFTTGKIGIRSGTKGSFMFDNIKITSK
ncbi:MAG: glycoside hydrolase family 43 [Paenibacillus sp.]|nr:glycoside hydrolase family 43 [Paenibacillus sp.]